LGNRGPAARIGGGGVLEKSAGRNLTLGGPRGTFAQTRGTVPRMEAAVGANSYETVAEKARDRATERQGARVLAPEKGIVRGGG